MGSSDISEEASRKSADSSGKSEGKKRLEAEKQRLFRQFVIGWIVHMSVIAIGVGTIILAAVQVFPDSLKWAGFGLIAIDLIWFQQFSKKYRG